MILQRERKPEHTQEQARHTMLRRRYAHTQKKKLAIRQVLSPSPIRKQQVLHPPMQRINRYTEIKRTPPLREGQVATSVRKTPRARRPPLTQIRGCQSSRSVQRAQQERTAKPTDPIPSDLRDATSRVWLNVLRRSTTQDSVTNVQVDPPSVQAKTDGANTAV